MNDTPTPLRFFVITKVPDPTAGGNLANAAPDVFVCTREPGDAYDDFGEYKNIVDVDPELAFTLHSPVFQVGEVLIVNENGREVCGAGRKPDKWLVEYRAFTNLWQAIDHARLVQEQEAEAWLLKNQKS